MSFCSAVSTMPRSSLSLLQTTTYPFSSSSSSSSASLTSISRRRLCSRIAALGCLGREEEGPPLRLSCWPWPLPLPLLALFLTANLLAWTWPEVPEPRTVERPMPLYILFFLRGAEKERRKRKMTERNLSLSMAKM